jgi:hypothetical protein
MIYLASPYSDPNPAVMEARFDAVCRYAGKLMNEGHVVYSPIAHCHPIAVRTGLPRDWAFWQKFDTEMLRGAAEFWVLKLPGWESSKGIKGEREIAEMMGIPVVEVEP